MAKAKLKKRLITGMYADSNPGTLSPDSLNALQMRSIVRGSRRSAEEYMSLGALYSILHRFASTFGYLDRCVVRKHNGRIERCEQHDITGILQEPSAMYSAFEYWRTLYVRFKTRSASYAEVERLNSGDIYQLHLPEDKSVEPDVVKDKQGRERLVYKIKGLEHPLDASDILHFRNINLDGYQGMSPVYAARKELDLGLNAQEYATRYFENGAAPSGYYTSPSRINQATIERLKQEHAEDVAGLENVGKTPIYGDGLEWKPFSNDPERSQLVETRRLAVEDAARLLGYPIPLLTGEGASEFHQALFLESLRLDLEVFEAELSFKCLTLAQRRAGYYIEHDLRPLKRSNISAKIADRIQVFGTGGITLDELREGLDLEPLPNGEGDLRLVATNNLDKVESLEDAKEVDQPTEEPQDASGTEGQETEQEGPSKAARAVFADVIGRVLRRGRKATQKAAPEKLSAVYATEAAHARQVLPDYCDLVGIRVDSVLACMEDEIKTDREVEQVIDALFERGRDEG